MSDKIKAVIAKIKAKIKAAIAKIKAKIFGSDETAA